MVHASLTAAWCFEDETTSYARDILRVAQDIVFPGPVIWLLDMVNVLVNERRKRITAAHTARAVRLFRIWQFRLTDPRASSCSMRHYSWRGSIISVLMTLPTWNSRYGKACLSPHWTANAGSREASGSQTLYLN